MLLALTVIAYVGVNVGEPYLRYYRFRDAMKQDAAFATLRSDDAIKRHLGAFADSLSIPYPAANVRVVRGQRTISISSSYVERFTIGPYSREIRFTPSAVDTF